MKLFTYFSLLIVFAISSSCTNDSKSTEQNTSSTNETMVTESMKTESKKLRHVVLFKFKDSASTAEIKTVEDAFSGLPSKISQIKDYEWGINNSPEGLDKGFTHCFFVTFDSEADRVIYLPHPAHKAFVSVLEPHLDDVLVIDYWTE